MRHTRLHLLLVLAICAVARAATPETAPADVIRPDDQWSQAITFSIPGSKPNATSQAIVVLPDAYLKQEQADGRVTQRWPVFYILHGYSGHCIDWYIHTKDTDRFLPRLADRFQAILVLVEGNYASWYLDALPGMPQWKDWQWETVVTKHLIPEIDKRYRTIASPGGRGICGLSMGGHGALFLAARHPDLFAAAGSMSGAMDVTQLRNKYDLAKRIGDAEKYPERWVEYGVITQAEKFVGTQTAILVDCGISDRLFSQNQELHAKLLKLNVPHDYIERPGTHSWSYWVNALPYHLQFLSDHLKEARERAASQPAK